jgi:hypothetical protein
VAVAEVVAVAVAGTRLFHKAGDSTPERGTALGRRGLRGATSDPRNLWPEPRPSPNPKDVLEDRLRSFVCTGRLGLTAAQRAIAGDWVRLHHRSVR